MNVNLLYPDREWAAPNYYFDYKNITFDLGLDAMFTIASKSVIYEHNEVKRISESDLFIKDTLTKVTLTPLSSAREIYYRQDIIKDCLNHEYLVNCIYGRVTKMLEDWEKAGRHINSRNTGQDQVSKLITRMHELKLFVDCLSDLKAMLRDEMNGLTKLPVDFVGAIPFNPNAFKEFKSEGMSRFVNEFLTRYNDELEDSLKDILKRISFYAATVAGDSSKANMIDKPRMVLDCSFAGGMKLDDFLLRDIETTSKKYRNPDSTIAKFQNYMNSLDKDSVSIDVNPDAQKQTAALELMACRYVMSYVEPFMTEFEQFFDRLRFQMAFYKGANQLVHHMNRFGVGYCFPKVCRKDRLSMVNLKEVIMCFEQNIEAVGNTCDIAPKMLIIITGANQGGKSTFLRSIGIAQVMMQCGLMVAASEFESAIFKSLFMHFTRREDQEMNSGRLDEELNRMNQIIDNLGEDSLVLLNESFATTTERDGSAIATDIVKALNEAGVKIITVTHLLSMAQKFYNDNKEREERGEVTDTTFFCAERKPDGTRTYRMIQDVPTLSSFGLDLYEKIIES